jgi:hypothetical protein
VDWQLTANISTTVASTTIVFTLVFGLRQLAEMNRATALSGFMKIMDILQAEDVRTARRIVLTTLKEKPYSTGSWTNDEILAAEKVCHTFDTVARLVHFSMCPKDLIIDDAGDSLRKTWAVLEPFVRDYQDQRGKNYWDDYVWLATEAVQFEAKRQSTATYRPII